MNKYAATFQIGDKPVVLLPLEEYERLQEDLEMLRSKGLPEKVAEARQQIKKGQVLTSEQLKETLGLG